MLRAILQVVSEILKLCLVVYIFGKYTDNSVIVFCSDNVEHEQVLVLITLLVKSNNFQISVVEELPCNVTDPIPVATTHLESTACRCGESAKDRTRQWCANILGYRKSKCHCFAAGRYCSVKIVGVDSVTIHLGEGVQNSMRL